MLQQISWQQYFWTVLVMTGLYYILCFIFIYHGRWNLLPVPGRLRTVGMHGEDQPDEVMSTAQHVIDELRPVLSRHQHKNELILAIQLHLKKYAGWEEPGFRDTINRFLVSECQAKCSIRLGEDDQRAVWITT